ncbi:hypothetical protein ACIBI4_19465 [Streptomyces sp. NPDC050418]|uniref:hypothetical protein n=1 Tax=Streptomyces sp. NPDC050418 TaxID=3365612 RepID=UPI0037A30402
MTGRLRALLLAVVLLVVAPVSCAYAAGGAHLPGSPSPVSSPDSSPVSSVASPEPDASPSLAGSRAGAGRERPGRWEAPSVVSIAPPSPQAARERSAEPRRDVVEEAPRETVVSAASGDSGVDPAVTVLPLGMGLVLIGLGFGFLALRLRRW